MDRSDDVFGTTTAGGTNGKGVVYELSPPSPGRKTWTETVLHSFAGADGGFPGPTLTADA